MRQLDLYYLVAYGPSCFDVVSDLFVGPRETTAVDTFWVVDFEAIFIVAVDEDKVSCGGEVAWTNGTDKVTTFVEFGL